MLLKGTRVKKFVIKGVNNKSVYTLLFLQKGWLMAGEWTEGSKHLYRFLTPGVEVALLALLPPHLECSAPALIHSDYPRVDYLYMYHNHTPN